jgi:arylsulfatase A-like enzyme
MVQHVDLLPTIAEAAGVEPPHAEQLLGISLIPREAETGGHQAVFAEWEGRVPYFVQRRLKGKPASEFARYREPFWMIRDHKYKYILREESQDELYDLAQDPGEESNLIADPPADATHLKDRLTEWKSLAEAQAPDQDRYTLDPEVRKHLESLGYM